MRQYLLSVHMVEGSTPPSPEVMQEMFRDVEAFNETLRKKNVWVFAGGLMPVESSTVVSAQGGEIVVSDGPFSEAKEQIGGFWVIQAPDLDAALAWAKQATLACRSPVEVRPFQEEPPAA